ncbi:Pyruvate kinase family protein [Trifolium repens]|nr:Pyruvate kinase family protein [Trifolium repens]
MTYKKLAEDVKPGSVILCADGTISFTVLSCDKAAGLVRCRCENSAMLGKRKNVNLPGVPVELGQCELIEEIMIAEDPCIQQKVHVQDLELWSISGNKTPSKWQHRDCLMRSNLVFSDFSSLVWKMVEECLGYFDGSLLWCAKERCLFVASTYLLQTGYLNSSCRNGLLGAYSAGCTKPVLLSCANCYVI